MASPGCTSEIVESKDELNLIRSFDGYIGLRLKLKAEESVVKSYAHPLKDDLNRLIKAIDIRTSPRAVGPSRQMDSDILRINALKKPAKVGISHTSAIEISESVTLKQALRKLCISQASEMAAMKRPTKLIDLSGVSETGTIKRLDASPVVQPCESGLSVDEGRENLVEISLVPENIINGSSGKATDSRQADNLEPSNYSVSPRPIRPVSRNKTFVKKKGKQEAVLTPGNSNRCSEASRGGPIPSKLKVPCQKRSISPASRRANPNGDVGRKNKDNTRTKPVVTPKGYDIRVAGEKMSESSRSREKGECSQSSKSSIGDYSSTSTSISGESHHSGSSGNGSRPHMSKDVRWIAIRHVMLQHGSLGLKNFKLLKRLGCGDIGTVYLAELTSSECLFALKVMDIDYLVSRKKMLRAQTEREILQMLDHPFLPTLYAHFTTDNLSCLVMEYCPGGDLHALRQKQPGRSFSEPAARFYVAEALLALEYLHMLGVVYRDLKPENILVREDGHIMLTDFDLSLRCTVSPSLVRSSSLGTQETAKKLSGPCAENSCIDPLCLQPSWVHVSCFSPRLISFTTARNRKQKSDTGGQVSPLPQLVVEPIDARSNSFVGTHEYLAPEIIRGDGHGSSVDWWTFGIFLYELLFGRTPFKGPGNEDTLTNVVSQSLKFPERPSVSSHARDLIRGLLIKEPDNRLGSIRGAAEIKQHPFFEGLNWALIRCAAPPETLRSYDVGTPLSLHKKKEGKCLDFRTNGKDVEFELF